MKKIGLIIMMCAWCAVFTTSAFAARSARVEVDSVVVRQDPTESSDVLETLSKDAVVAASNLPTSGFYKVRTASGVVGWLPAEALGLPAEADSGSIPPPRPVSEVRAKQQAGQFNARIFGDLNFLTSSDLSTAVAVNSLKTTYALGAELGYLLSPKIRALFRVEWVRKSVNLVDAVAATSTRYELSSIPLRVGAQYELFEASGFSVDLALLYGLGISSNLSVTSATSTEKTGGTAFTGLGKFNLNYRFSPSFGAFAEAGYRYLKVKDIAVIDAMYTNTTVPLDFSGVVAGVGLVAYF